MILVANPEHGCELASELVSVFSEHHPPPSLPQPIRRKMEVTIAARYGILGTCLIEPVPLIMPIGGAHGPTENSQSSALLSNEALDVVTIDLSQKEGNARQRSWEGGVTVGSTSIAKGDVKHTRASSSSKEVTTLVRPNVIAGSQFQLRDTCHKSAIAEVLSYKATHMPPIESVSKLEDAGLDTTPRDCVTSDFAMPVKLKCKGEFLLLGSGLKKHTFEMGRSLGEFRVKVDEGPRQKLMRRFHHPNIALLQAKQNLEIDFTVNHDFDLSMYRDAHLYWLLAGAATERTPALDVLDALRGGN